MLDSFDQVDAPYQSHPPATALLQKRLSYHKPHFMNVEKSPRDISVKLSVTETDFVVVEDTKLFTSNAVVLKVSEDPAHYHKGTCK